MHKSVGWKEDGSCSVLARLTARGASGAATGVDGEGSWVQQADVSSIGMKLFDLDSDTPDTPTETETLTVSSVVLDTPDETGEVWDVDDIGYNFVHDLANTYFPSPLRRYRVEYTFTLVGGIVAHLSLEGLTDSIRSS